MTNREAIEYIERECHTCKGFYAPENECIAVSEDCFESKRLAISALQEGQKRYRERYGGEGCYNASNQHPVDEFICSECGVIIRDCQRYEYDEDSDDWSCYEFVYRYCPMCGKRIGDKE